MTDQLEQRVTALERAVTDGDGDPAALAEAAVTAERLDELETAIGDLEDRVAELEAATQALRGYVGNIRAVNREVEQRADLALSRVEAVGGEEPSGTPPVDRESAATSPGAGAGSDSQRDPHLESGRCESCGRPTASTAGGPESGPGNGASGTGLGDLNGGNPGPQSSGLGPGELPDSEEEPTGGPIERLRALL